MMKQSPKWPLCRVLRLKIPDPRNKLAQANNLKNNCENLQSPHFKIQEKMIKKKLIGSTLAEDVPLILTDRVNIISLNCQNMQSMDSMDTNHTVDSIIKNKFYVTIIKSKFCDSMFKLKFCDTI